MTLKGLLMLAMSKVLVTSELGIVNGRVFAPLRLRRSPFYLALDANITKWSSSTRIPISWPIE